MGYVLSTISSCFLCMGEYFTLQREKNEKELKKIIKNEISKKNSPKKQSPVKFFTHDYESELFELISPEINFHSTKHVNKQNVHYNDEILNNGKPQKRVNKYKLKLDYCD